MSKKVNIITVCRNLEMEGYNGYYIKTLYDINLADYNMIGKKIDEDLEFMQKKVKSICVITENERVFDSIVDIVRKKMLKIERYDENPDDIILFMEGIEEYSLLLDYIK